MEKIKFIYDEAAVIVNAGNRDHLVIGDLHIGAERDFIKRGIRIYSAVEAMIKKIKKLMKEFNANDIIILGDVKDTVLYPDAVETNELKMFFKELAEYKITITTGNHDPHLKEIVDCNVVDELILDEFAFLHGHKWPSEDAMRSKYIFAGHNHIAVSLKDKNGAYYNQKAWLVSKFNKKEGLERYPEANKNISLVVLPAFNDLIVGMPVHKEIESTLNPLFRNKIFNYKSAQVYSLRGDVIGTPSKIKKLK
jgi:uncharacterized protein